MTIMWTCSGQCSEIRGSALFVISRETDADGCTKTECFIRDSARLDCRRSFRMASCPLRDRSQVLRPSRGPGSVKGDDAEASASGSARAGRRRCGLCDTGERQASQCGTGGIGRRAGRTRVRLGRRPANRHRHRRLHVDSRRSRAFMTSRASPAPAIATAEIVGSDRFAGWKQFSSSLPSEPAKLTVRAGWRGAPRPPPHQLESRTGPMAGPRHSVRRDTVPD